MTSIRFFKTLFCAFTMIALFQFDSYAQSEEDQIKAAIQTMFDGMRAGDSSQVHSVFSDEAVMKTIASSRETGQKIIRDSPLSGFLKAVGTPHEIIWDEKVISYDIKIDGPMATAWVPYEFYAGENFSHCGVNNFTLFKGDGSWKVIYLIDTRKRGDDCK